MSQAEYMDAFVIGVAFTQNDKGTDQIEIEFDVANNGQPTGLQRRTWLYISDKAWPYTEAKLKKIGFAGDAENFDWDGNKLVRVSKTMEPRMDGNGDREVWDIALPKRQAEPIDAGRLAKLNEKLRVSFGDAPAKTAAGKAPSRSSAPTRAKADDVGFSDADGAWDWYTKTLGDAASEDQFLDLVDSCGGTDDCDWASFKSKALPF